MKDHRGASPKEEAQAIAHDARLKAVREAGERIAHGEGTAQDIYLAAQDLAKAERAGFIAALLPGDTNDPTWGVGELLTWLGSTDASLRRKLYRYLGKLSEQVPAVVNDPVSGWRLPRSAAYKHFMALFLELHGSPALQAVATRVTRARRLAPSNPLEQEARHDSDETETDVRLEKDGLAVTAD
jgi:hypothetical protein